MIFELILKKPKKYVVDFLPPGAAQALVDRDVKVQHKSS